jgi:hypothetical protein
MAMAARPDIGAQSATRRSALSSREKMSTVASQNPDEYPHSEIV